jgi:hypothetical protein
MSRRVVRAAVGVAIAIAALVPATGSASAPAWSTPATVYDTTLLGVSCSSSSFCVTVGYGGRALTWDGHSWSKPVDVDGAENLEAVSCSSASFCAAVDEHGGAVTWDGRTWSTPADVDGTDELFGVSCVSSSFCIAVGANGTAVTWTGHAWSAPADVDGASALYSVSCTSTSFCTAVDGAHALRWNGSSWGAPVTIDPGSNLGWVSCASPSSCAAVENFGNGTTIWDGGTWSALTDIDGPSGTFTNRLAGVSCASASFCVAVAEQWMSIAWNGSSWGTPAAVHSVANTALTGVSCVSASFCAAVSSGGSATFYGVASAGATTPVLGRSVAAATVSGHVLIERPGTGTFVPLTGSTLIPVGSTVDATNGRVRLTAATASGHATRSGEFYDGEFRLAQARSGLTRLTLTGGTACARAAARAPKPAKSPRQRSLWGDGHGSFETVGDDAAATDLGTRWLVRDTCTGTLVRVTEGTVRVTDLVTGRSFSLSAPNSYFAKR